MASAVPMVAGGGGSHEQAGNVQRQSRASPAASAPAAFVAAGPIRRLQLEYQCSLHTNTAIKLLQTKRSDYAAKLELEKALECDSKDAGVYNLLGLVHDRLQQFPLAEKNYMQSIELDSTDVNNHISYGVFLEKQARLEEARAIFQAALKLDPKSWMAHRHLAQIWGTLRDFDKAEFHYKEAIAATSKEKDMHVRLHREYAYFLATYGCHTEAIDAFEAALKLDPTDKSTLDALERERYFLQAISTGDSVAKL